MHITHSALIYNKSTVYLTKIDYTTQMRHKSTGFVMDNGAVQIKVLCQYALFARVPVSAACPEELWQRTDALQLYYLAVTSR